MTDQEKLQKIFAAALKEPAHPAGGTPKQAFPVAPSPFPDTPAGKSDAAVASGAGLPDVAVNDRTQESAAPEAAANAIPKGPVLDDAASAELAVLLDEQHRRKARKRRREALVTAVVLLGLSGGGFAWFVQAPERIQAFEEVMHDIRSVGDVKSLVANYQAALDRIGARSRQIDEATTAMGVKKSVGDEQDPNMDAEMKQMMGGEGKTVGERNQALQKKFKALEKKAGAPLKTTASIQQEDAF